MQRTSKSTTDSSVSHQQAQPVKAAEADDEDEEEDGACHCDNVVKYIFTGVCMVDLMLKYWSQTDCSHFRDTLCRAFVSSNYEFSCDVLNKTKQLASCWKI